MNWLVAYSALLGPVVGVVLADYYMVRGRMLNIDDLYSMEPTAQYWYQVSRWQGITHLGGDFLRALSCSAAACMSVKRAWLPVLFVPTASQHGYVFMSE